MVTGKRAELLPESWKKEIKRSKKEAVDIGLDQRTGTKKEIQIDLPEKVAYILDTLLAHGYEAHAVGGCVRDSLLGRTPQDWDVTTSAVPMQVKALFPRTVDTGLTHGTVTVLIGREGFEVTTYRIDGEYVDGRHPKEVFFTPNLLEDLKRRDFTMNAMAYHHTNGLTDAFGGTDDLAAGIVRCVGNPMDRFKEDALRMLRAVRFAAQLDFQIEEHTRDAIRRLAPDLKRISAERIQAELVKLLLSPHPEYMRELYTLGISKVILPELDQMMETKQNHPHHCRTVGEHTICGLTHTAPDRVLRLAMLFHDIAKPVCRTTDENGIDHFYGHPEKSAQMAKKIFRRLKFDRETMERVCALVRWHDYNPLLTEEKVRRAVVKTGREQYPRIFALKRADILAQSDYQREEKLAYVDRYEEMYEAMTAKGDCISLKQLAVTGRDIMVLGVQQGRQIGTILNLLLEQVIEDPEKNRRDVLLELAQEYLHHQTLQ